MATPATAPAVMPTITVMLGGAGASLGGEVVVVNMVPVFVGVPGGVTLIVSVDAPGKDIVMDVVVVEELVPVVVVVGGFVEGNVGD